MRIDPRRLAVLLAIHRHGGVLAAADESGVTASAISQQVARLEEETGLTLLDRQPRGAVLTPSGRVLVEAAERIESELTDARRALLALQGDVTGTVAIGAFQSVIQALLVPLVGDLRQRLPGLEIVLREVEATSGQRELREGALDLLMLEADSPTGRAAPRGMHDVAVLDDPWVVAIPIGAPAPSSVHALAQATWLGVEATAAAHSATARLHATFENPPRVQHLYSDSDVAMSMVAGGLGVALLPSLSLLGALRSDTVQAVSMAGLGNRHLIARHRTSRAEPRREVLTVLDELLQAAEALDLTAI